MLVYEAPNNNPDEYSPAYYFIPDPTAAEDLPVAEYQQNVAAVCLGAVAAGRITQWQADKLLWDLAETYGPKILNQTRKIFEKVVTHELEAKTSRWTKLTGAAIRGELTTDVLMPELRRIHSTELGDKGSITWVTSEGLLA